MARLLDRLTGRAAPTIGEQVALHQSFPWPDGRELLATSLADYVAGGYAGNSIIFALIEARLALFCQAEPRLQDRRTQRLYDSPLLAQLERPWPNGTTADLLARMEQDVSLTGNAYVYRSRDRLVRLRPDWVEIGRIIWTDERGFKHHDVAGYVYHENGFGGGDTHVLDVQDVAHWTPTPDPLARWRGMSWITPVVREINADQQMTDYRAAFFTNAATPNLMIRYSQKLSPQTIEAIRERWQARYSGATSAGTTVVLDEGADITVIGQSMEQMTFGAVQAAGEARMASAAGVPPIIAGLKLGLENGTYSNFEQAMRLFANGQMTKQWVSAAAALAKLVDVPDGSRLVLDTSRIPALQDAETDRATAAHIYAQAASVLITTGFEPESVQDALIAGDMSLMAHSGLVSVQLQAPGQVTAAQPQPPDEPDDEDDDVEDDDGSME